MNFEQLRPKYDWIHAEHSGGLFVNYTMLEAHFIDETFITANKASTKLKLLCNWYSFVVL